MVSKHNNDSDAIYELSSQDGKTPEVKISDSGIFGVFLPFWLLFSIHFINWTDLPIYFGEGGCFARGRALYKPE